MIPLVQYLTNEPIPSNDEEAKKIMRLALSYTLITSKLYKMGKDTLMLRSLGEIDITLVLMEVHEGICRSRIQGGDLAHKFLRANYYCPIMMKDIIDHVNKRDTCQQHSNLHHASTRVFHFVTFP